MSRVFSCFCFIVSFVVPFQAYAVDLSAPTQGPWTSNDPTLVGSTTTPNFTGSPQASSAWYLRGDLAYSLTNMPEIDSSSSIISGTTAPSYGGVQFGVGYKFSSWFRTDFTYEYDMKYNSSGNQAQAVPASPSAPNNLACVRAENVAPQYDASGAVIGYSHQSWDKAGCTLASQFTLARQNILLNAYIDLGHFGGFSPYIGAGIGTSILNYKSTTTAYFADSGAAIGNYVVPQYTAASTTSVGEAGYYDLDKAQSRTKYNLAYALHAGVSYEISDTTSLDIGYRYLNSGSYSPLSTATSSTSTTVDSHQIHLGLRFLLQ
jgi:opacity protein-like surface antigen